MSGGSWDYIGFAIQDAANRLCESKDVLRVALGKHMRMVGNAMVDVEWVDSGDRSPGDETEAIRACLAPGAELDAAREMLVEAMNAAKEVLERTKP